jgi:regulatory protein
MNFLARREHTRQELHQKLQRRFPDAALVAVEVQRLSDENLQSDERFAENFVRYRASLGFGFMHVRQDIRQRGLSDAQIALAVDCAEIDWVVLAEEVYRKKFGEIPPADIKEKAKRVRYMQYRGFRADEYQHLF